MYRNIPGWGLTNCVTNLYFWQVSWGPQILRNDRPGVKFTNILWVAFMRADPRSEKKTEWLTLFFALLRSAGIKCWWNQPWVDYFCHKEKLLAREKSAVQILPTIKTSNVKLNFNHFFHRLLNTMHKKRFSFCLLKKKPHESTPKDKLINF